MDAAYTSLKKIALFLVLALLFSAAASAQPAFVLNGGSNQTAITLVANQSTSVSVVSSGAPTQITFGASTTYATGDLPWLCINNPLNSPCDRAAGLITPNNLFVLVGQNAGTLTNGIHTATINLAATDGSGATGTITVQYTANSFQTGGGGSGNLTITPTTPSASASYGTSTALFFQVSTSANTSDAFSVVQPSVSWATNFVQTGGNTAEVSPGQPATFEVFLNGAGQAETTLATTLTISFATGTLSIPIQFGNGVAVGGSGTGSGTLSLSTNPVALSYSTATPNTFPSASVTLTSTSGSAITYSFITQSTNNWLLINGQTQGSSLSLPGTLIITADSNVATLAAGTSTATATITGSDGSTVLLTVNVTVSGASANGLTVSPSPVTINAALNGTPVSQAVTITSAGGGSVTVSVAGSGLTVSAPGSTSISAGGSTTVTVTGSPTGLISQTYSGTLTVTVGGVSTSDQINFQVGSNNSGGGTNASIAAAPSSMTFAYEQNSSMQITQSQQAYLFGSGSYTAVATVNNGSNWLSVLNASGTLPQQLQVTTTATGLAAGTYTGAVTFTNSSNGNTSVISVTLSVTGTTAIYTVPGDLVFAFISGTTSANQSQAFTISSSDGSVVSVSSAVSNPGNTPWLTLSSSGAGTTGSSSPTVTVNANGLANGVYTGAVTITGAVGNSPLNVPVVLAVTGSGVSSGSGSLTLGASALSLSAAVNGAAVSTTLGVSASTNTTYTVTTQGSFNGVTWLSVAPSGTLTTSGNPNLTVIANPYNFPAGNYSGTISLTSNGGTQTVNVTMVVGGTSTGANITVTANGAASTTPSLSFTASGTGVTVASQYLTVSSAAGQSSVSFQASAATTSGGSWITLSTTAGTQYSTPYSQLTVSVNTAGLAAGTYSGSVTITPTGGTAVTVPVTLTIGGGATISASQTPLTFSFATGAAAPASQTVNVTIANATSGAFAASATSTPAGWLAVTPATGTATSTTPGAVTVSISPTGLAAGTYSGTVTVMGSGGASGTSTIPVTLTVTVSLPTITSVLNAASSVNEPISPGEIISIYGTNIGPVTPASLTLDSTGKFVTTTLGGVQVMINGYSMPLTYVSAAQINAIVPYEISGIQNPTILVKTNVTGSTGGQTSNGFQVTSAATAAGIFTQNGTGTGPGAILNSNLSVNSASNAAPRGSTIVIYMTGEGQTTPQGVDGKVTAAPYPAPLLPVAVTIGGAPASVTFMGEAPGLVSGVLQLNVVVPSTLTTTGAVAVSVAFGGGSTSQTGVTVAIQ